MREQSVTAAKERLKCMIHYENNILDEETMGYIRRDIGNVITKYVDVEPENNEIKVILKEYKKKRIAMFKQYKLRNYKFILVMYVVILNVIGILLIGSAKPSVQSKQILGMIAGLTIMVMLSLIDYNFILKFSWLIYFFMVGVLLLVMFAGDDAGGAQRWFEIGSFRFQPSELAKILIILFFAYFFMKHEEKINTPKVLILSFVLAGIPLALILKQPDLSTTIVTALIFAALLFVAGLSYKIVTGVLAVSIPSAVIMFTLLIQDKLPFIKSYQVTRVMAWLYPDDYPADAYQQQNSIMAIGSGQLWGKGLNNTDATSVKNGNFIRNPDRFIFAVAGEELGLSGHSYHYNFIAFHHN